MGRRSFIVALAVALVTALAGPVSGAQASAKSIKHVLKAYDGRVLTAEGAVLSAVGTYKQTKDPAPVVAALQGSIKVLGELRHSIEQQGAAKPKVKKAKHLIVVGVSDVISAYTKLETAVSEKTVNEAAAKAEAEKASVAAKAAHKDLEQAVKLLG